MNNLPMLPLRPCLLGASLATSSGRATLGMGRCGLPRPSHPYRASWLYVLTVWSGAARARRVNIRVRWGRSLRNMPRRLRTPEGSLSDEGGGDIHGDSTIGFPLASRPWMSNRRFPYPMPSPYLSSAQWALVTSPGGFPRSSGRCAAQGAPRGLKRAPRGPKTG
eukprot:4464786-Pyramimonas_sp.AAC.1